MKQKYFLFNYLNKILIFLHKINNFNYKYFFKLKFFFFFLYIIIYKLKLF